MGIKEIRRMLFFATHLYLVYRLTVQSFIITTLPYTLILPPLLLALALRPLTFNHFNYLPAGPTPLVFALLAQYHAAIPHVYKYRIATSSPTSPNQTQAPSGILLSDKSMTYLLAAQLAFSQFPGSLLSAGVGWLAGYAWRNEVLPGAGRWRVPGWVVREKREGGGYEGLRRRLEGEERGAVGAASGADASGEGAGRQRRTLGTQILDQFRGAF